MPQNNPTPIGPGTVLPAPAAWLDQKRQYEAHLDQAMKTIGVQPQMGIDRTELARTWRKEDPLLARLGADVMDAVPEVFQHAKLDPATMRNREALVLQLTEAKSEADSMAQQVNDQLLTERATLHRENATVQQIITANLDNPGLDPEVRARLYRHARPFLEQVAATKEAVQQNRAETRRIKAEGAAQEAQTQAEVRKRDIEIEVLRGGSVPDDVVRTPPTSPRPPRRRRARRSGG